MPRSTGPNVPHWSRWEKSATTFGPAGRIALTAVFVLSVPVAVSFGMFLYLVWAPVFGWFFLSSVWAKGWVVPGERVLPTLPDRSRPEPAPEPRAAAPIAFRIVIVAAAVAGLLAFLQGPAEVRAGVLMAVGFGLLYALFRWSLSR